MTMLPKIYIAGPYRIGNKEANVSRMMDVVDKLYDLGFVVLCPLYSHFQNERTPRYYKFWIKIDLEWIDVCDGLYRMQGESKGADIEVEYAAENHIPVFTNIEKMKEHFNS